MMLWTAPPPDKVEFWSAMVCPLMTQSGQSALCGPVYATSSVRDLTQGQVWLVPRLAFRIRPACVRLPLPAPSSWSGRWRRYKQHQSVGLAISFYGVVFRPILIASPKQPLVVGFDRAVTLAGALF